MPYKRRMTEEEYLSEKQRVEDFKEEIKGLYKSIEEENEKHKQRVADIRTKIKETRAKKNKVQSRITWYERPDQQPMSDKERYGNTEIFKMYGKTGKDLTSEERKEYKRLLTQKSRAKRKALNEQNSELTKNS